MDPKTDIHRRPRVKYIFTSADYPCIHTDPNDPTSPCVPTFVNVRLKVTDTFGRTAEDKIDVELVR